MAIPIYMAPIQGFTDYVYRSAHCRVFGGVSKYFTPFIRLEGGQPRKKDAADLAAGPMGGFPGVELVPQVIANSCQEIRLLAGFVQECGFEACDINFGCPFPQQAKKQRGCGILQNPERADEVLACLGEFPGIKFSLKMRLGYSSPSESLALADAINSAPLRFVTIHPRLGRQMYGGQADIEGFRKLKNALCHPVVYNGDLVDAGGIEGIEALFPDLRAVMIGRGLLANPALGGIYGGSVGQCGADALIRFAGILAEGYRRHFGGQDFMVLDKMKSLWAYSAFGGKAQAKRIQKSRTIAEFMANVAISLQQGAC